MDIMECPPMGSSAVLQLFLLVEHASGSQTEEAGSVHACRRNEAIHSLKQSPRQINVDPFSCVRISPDQKICFDVQRSITLDVSLKLLQVARCRQLLAGLFHRFQVKRE